MSEFVAGAFVDVKPDPAGFRAELKRIVESAIANTKAFKIPIEADPKRFKSTIQAAIRDVGKQGVPIEASMDKAAFRADVKKKVSEATKGLKVIIPVEAGEAKATKTRAKKTTTAVDIPEQVPGQISLPGLQRAAQAQVPGEESTQAITASTTAKKQAAKATKELTDEEKRAESIKRTLKSATDQQASAERLLAQANLTSTVQQEKSVLAGRARTEAARAEKSLNSQLAISGKALNAEDRKALDTALAKATAIRQEATALKKSSDDESKRLTLQGQANETRDRGVKLLEKEIKSLKTASELQDHHNALTSIDAKLRRESSRATSLGLDADAAANNTLRERIKKEQELIVTQRDVLKGEGRRAKAQRTASRGAFSSILSLLGVRGATLAANSAFLIGAAGAALFAKSLGSFAKFETELNTFAAISGATAEQMEEVSKTAKRLGADITLPAVTAADAAQAMTELSRAGLGVQDSLDGARGVLELAAAAQISNSEAATLAASALNAFGLAGDQATHVADLLAAAANASQGSITEMGAAMQQASAIARQVGLTLDDTVAILTLFARNGLRGSDAGTSFRTAMSRLVAPTKKASDLIAALGLNVRDAEGNLRADVFAQFGQATKNLTPALRDMIAQTIAGQDAIRAFSIGAREGTRGLQLARLQTAQQGAAARVAAARTQGLAGSFSALRSNAETLGTSLGGLASGPAKQVAASLNSIFLTANQLISLDWDALTDHAEKSFGQFERNMKRHATGLKTIFLDPFSGGGGFGNFQKGLGQLFGAAGPDPEEERLNNIRESLERLNTIRVSVAAQGGPITGITKEIKRLQAELKKANADAGLIIPVTPLEKALHPLQEARKAAEDFKRTILEGDPNARVGFLDEIIRNMDVRIKLTAKNFKKSVKDEISGTDLAQGFKQQFDLIAKAPTELGTPEVLSSLDDRIRLIKQVVTEQKKLSIVEKPQGLLDPGNIDLLNRKVSNFATNFGKSIKTIAVTTDKGTFLLPTMIDGIQKTEEQAKAHFETTGEHLGRFTSIAAAEAYAKTLQQQQSSLSGAMSSVTRAAGVEAGPIAGAAGRKMGLDLIKSIQAAINAAVAADDPELAAALKAKAQGIAKLFGVELQSAFAGIKVPLTDQQLADALLPQRIATARAEAFGTTADQIIAKQAELDKFNKQLTSGKVIKGSAQEETLLNNIGAAKQEIRSLREKQASDQKEADQKSDKKVLDSFDLAERKRQNALVVAQSSESLKDDIRRELELRAFYLQQIDQVSATVRDDETRRDKLADLNQKLFDIDQDIARDRAERRTQIREKTVGKLDAAAERAAETETLQDDVNRANRKVAFWRAQVKIIKKLVRDRKATADELEQAERDLDEAEDQARAKRRERRQQIKDLQEERLDLKIQIAQDTGNVNAEIAAREEKIRNIKKQMQATKKESIARLRLTAQLRAEQKELEDLKNEKKEASEKGTTVFELLSEFAGSFSGGNLIGRDQPFAGPTGFVSDISQFLVRQPFRRGGEVPPPKPPAAKEDIFSRNDQAHFGRLTTAVEENTAVWTGRTRTKTTPSETKTSIDRNDRAHYATAVQSRRVREGRSGI